MSAVGSRTLLERLESPDRPGEREIEESQDELLASIQRNLQRILNTQRGFSPTVPEYGFEQIVDAVFNRATVVKLETDLKRAIELYEPRLSAVQVRFLPGSETRLSLRFDVVATASLRGQAHGARFQTVVENSGELTVRRL